MKSAIIALISLVKCIYIKIIRCHHFTFAIKNLLQSNVKFDFCKKARVQTGSLFSCRRNVQISVQNDAELIIGENVFINTNSVIACHKSIRIGDNVKFGPGTMIFDHDHTYKSDKITDEFAVSDITIGDDVWIGANCVILRGTHIGNKCIFGAGCIIKGDYVESSFVVQKRESSIYKLNDFSLAE